MPEILLIALGEWELAVYLAGQVRKCFVGNLFYSAPHESVCVCIL